MCNATDVTVTSGNAVVFASGLTVGDIVDITYPTTATSSLMQYDQFTATASQTTFTTSKTYNSNKIQVFAQGVLMRNGTDVTVSNGTTVVFATGLVVGTLVDVNYPPA